MEKPTFRRLATRSYSDVLMSDILGEEVNDLEEMRKEGVFTQGRYSGALEN